MCTGYAWTVSDTDACTAFNHSYNNLKVFVSLITGDMFTLERGGSHTTFSITERVVWESGNELSSFLLLDNSLGLNLRTKKLASTESTLTLVIRASTS